jgi:hypothetical protein
LISIEPKITKTSRVSSVFPEYLQLEVAHFQGAKMVIAASSPVKKVSGLDLLSELCVEEHLTPALRILRISSSSHSQRGEHKSATGEGGYRIDASRNFWDGSGLKIDSTSTDVAWGYGCKLNTLVLTVLIHTLVFNNKILTSARNGEVIMWDLSKTGPSKYGAFLLQFPLKYGVNE